MTATPWQHMSGGERLRWVVSHWRYLIPLLVISVGFLAMTVPMFAPLPVVPNFALLLVFLWAIYRPHQLPAWTGFFAGLCGDIVLGTAVGANAMLIPLFIVAVQATSGIVQRASWLGDWMLCAPMLFIYHAALWKLVAIGSGELPFLPLLTQAAASLAAYPVLAFVFARIQRRLDRL